MANAVLNNSALLNRSDEERRRIIQEFLEAPKGRSETALEDINAAICRMENEFGMESEQMREFLRDGKIRETEAYCHWLLLLSLRDRLVHVSGSGR